MPKNHLCEGLMEIYRDDEGRPWLDEDRVSQFVRPVERINVPKLMEGDKAAFDLIVGGTAPTVYEVAEVLNLQEVRDRAGA